MCYNIDSMDNCIFCKISKGEIPSYKVWEDDKHLAFLSIFPNTEGVTVVTTKKHYPSYFATLSDNVLGNLVNASKKVALILDSKLDDVGRTGMIFEGFGVDHIHAKLYPMHGTANIKEWEAIESKIDKYFKKYEGYLSSHDYKGISKEELEKTHRKLIK